MYEWRFLYQKGESKDLKYMTEKILDLDNEGRYADPPDGKKVNERSLLLKGVNLKVVITRGHFQRKL